MSVHTPPAARPTVFVGNLSYDTTEEQLIEVLREVGPVKSFKINFDRQTNKPKGFGFAEYYDVETAMSAVRNLNGREFMKRQLKISFAKADNSSKGTFPPSGGAGGDGPPGQFNGAGSGQAHQSMYGASMPIDGAADHVEAAVAGMTDTFLFDVVRQMKGYIEAKPDDAKRLLDENPQIAFALVHMQIKMGLVDQVKARNLLSSGTEQRIQQHEKNQSNHRQHHPPHQQHHQMMQGMHGGQQMRMGGGMGGGHRGPPRGGPPFGNPMHQGISGVQMMGGGGMPASQPMRGNGSGNAGPARGVPILDNQGPPGNDQARKMEIYEKVRNMTVEEIRNGPYEGATREKLLKIKYALQNQ